MKKIYCLILILLNVLFINKLSSQITISNGSSTLCSDTLYDSGGHLVDYNHNESFEYTISPTSADSVRLYLDSVHLATGDTIFIYDGSSSASPLLLAIDSLTVIPDSITSSGSSLTVLFTSDAADSAGGFLLYWAGFYSLNVSISASSNSVCELDVVNFMVTDSTNAGDTPSFEWKLNGSVVGSNLYTYSSALSNGDEVYVVMTGSPLCGLSSGIDSSSVETITVSNIDTASVSISATDTNICAGTSVTFTANPINGGASPTYSWTVNGSPVGTNSSTYMSSALSNGDFVSVTMASDIGSGCLVDSITSDSTEMVVTVNTTASISLTGDTVICAGTNASFTASPTNEGAVPVYSWTVNGSPVGANLPTYSSTTLSNGDYVTVTMASNFNSGCLIDSISADSLQISVTNNTTASVSVSADDPSVCDGTNVTFTATPSNGGSSPTYSWRLNGSNVGSNSPTYMNNTLSDDDYVAVTMASDFNGGCLIDSISADSLQMNINPNPSASISGSTDILCNGDATGDATAMGSGGTEAGTYDFLWDDFTAQTTAVATGLNSGTYIVIVTDDSSCTDTASIFIDEPTAISIAFTVTDVSSFGGNNGQIAALASGGTPFTSGQNGYYHNWKSGQGTGHTGQRTYTHTITGLASNWYVDTITDFNGCIFIDSAFVNQPTTLLGGEIRIGGLTSKAICDEDTVGNMTETVAATGGVGTLTYTWQISTNLLSWSDFASSNTTDYDFNDSITQNSFIRRRVVDPAFNTAYSNTLFLNYIGDQTINIIGLQNKYCENDNRDVIFGSPSAPGTGTFANSPWINPTTKEFIPDSAAASAGGAYNLLTYSYIDQFGCFSSGMDSTPVYTTTSGTIGIGQTVFDQSDTLDTLTSTYPGGNFSGTGVYKSGSTWLFDPGLVPTVPFTQFIQFAYTNPNGCTTRDSIQVSVQSTQITITTNSSIPTEFNSCYTDAIGNLHAIVPPGETVTQYRWLIQDMATGRYYLEDNLAYTYGSWTNTTISTTFDPKNFKPIAAGLPYNVIGATPAGLTSLRVYFQHTTVANPFISNLIRENLELMNLTTVTVSPNQTNSDGSIGIPFQYCVDVDSVQFSANVYPLGARPTTKTYSILPSVIGQLNDNANGNSRFYPTISGVGVKNMNFTYEDLQTGCSIDTNYALNIDALPNVSLLELPDSNCANDGMVSFYGTPYATNKGNFTSATSALLGLTHVNGDSVASITATTLNTGQHQIKYTFTDPAGCVSNDSTMFNIYPLPILSLNLNPSGFSDPTICVTDTIDMLVFGTVNGTSNTIGDSIVGPGITYPNPSTNLDGQAVFNPSIAGIGNHTIRFYFTNANGCSDFVDSVVTVNGLPNPSFATSTNDYNTCMVSGDNLNFTPTGAVVGTSTYFINGSPVTAFEPVVNNDIFFGSNNVVHRIVETATTCINFDTIQIVVDTFPIVSLSGINSTYCYNNALINFTGSPVSPGILNGNTASYFYSGPSSLNFTDTKTSLGQNTGSFVADSTNLGSHQISYNYTDSITGCFNGDTVSFDILDIPTLSIERGDNPNSPLIHCLGDAIPYVPHINGNPDVGSYYLTGPGFLDSTSSIFYPDSAGVSTGPNHHTVTYGTTDPNGCFNEIDSMIVVLATSDAAFSLSTDSSCIDPFNTITITPSFVGGSNSTFYYHGTSKQGQASMSFYLDSAVVGLDSVTYVYDDGTGCSDTNTQYITVKDTPTVSFSNVALDYCLDQGQFTIWVDKPSLGNSYFRSWHYNPGRVFNNLLDSAALLPGDSDITFTPFVVDGLDTIVDDFIDVEYIYTDQNGCVGHANDVLFINSLPELSINSSDLDLAVCAQQEIITFTGIANSIPNLPGGYFTGSQYGISNNLVNTDSSSVATYGSVPDDAFFRDTVYYHYVDGLGCYNNTFETMDIKQLPPASFSIVPGPNPSPKNLCPDGTGFTSSYYDSCSICNTVTWPTANVARSWLINGVSAKVSKRFNPGTAPSDDISIFNGYNTITQEMTDDRWFPACTSEHVDSFFLDSFPIVDVFVDSLYCSNEGSITVKGSPASAFGVGVGTPSVFSSTNMFITGFTNNLNATGLDSMVFGSDSLAVASTGLYKNYTIRYTYTDPLTNCKSNKQRTFVLKTKPNLNLTATTKVFCPYDQAIDINVFVNNNNATGVGDSIVGQGIQGTVVNGKITYNPQVFKGDSTASKDPISYYHTDIDGCQNVFVDNAFLVRAQPILNLFIDTNLIRKDSICFNDPAANLNIQYWDTVNNQFAYYGGINGPNAPGPDNYFGFQVDDNPIPSYAYASPYSSPTAKSFNPRWDSKNDTSGVSTSIRFIGTYATIGECADTIYDTIVTHPKPVASFFLDGTCSKYSPVMHGTNSYIDTLLPPFSSSDGIKRYIWQVDDSVAALMSNGAGDTIVDYTYPYSLSVGKHDLSLRILSNKDCLSDLEEQEITFVKSPEADFTWNMDDECAGATVEFTGGESDIPVGSHVTWNWIFGDGATSSDSGFASHDYTSVEKFTVTLELQDGINCKDTMIKDIYIRPYVSEYPFLDDFNSPYSGWSVWKKDYDSDLDDPIENPNGYTPTWFARGISPNGILKNHQPNDTAWYLENHFQVTNPDSGLYRYENGMKTSVIGPCFDLSSMQRPMLTLESVRNMEINDGVVIQYTTDKGLPMEDVEWHNVGEYYRKLGNNIHYETGINWYDKDNIFGNPGEQADLDGKIGWVGLDTTWKESRHDIDVLRDSSYVRFRVAFGSSADAKGEGMIFDDFGIRERKKNVVFESFTNSSANQNKGIMENYDAVVANSLDIIDIQYHTSFPGSDPMNADNTSDPSARSVYYGISEVPYLQGDGIIYSNFISSQSFGYNTLKPRSLEDPKFIVNMSFDSLTNKVTTDIIPTAEEFSTNPVNVTVQVALLEKTINGSQFGSSVASNFANYPFKNTLKKLYPTAAGTTFNNLSKGDLRTVTYEILYENFYGSTDNFKVVAFVQNKVTKEIYQAKWVDFDNQTAVGEPKYNNLVSNNINYNLYPNPTNGLANMAFDQELKDDVVMQIYNQVGVLVLEDRIAQGTRRHSFDLNGLTPGMYFVMLNNGDQKVAIKKLMLSK